MTALPVAEPPVPDPGDVPPAAALTGLIVGFMVSQGVYAVAELGVATILEQEGPLPVGELAERTACVPDALRRLVRSLAQHGIFRTDGDLVALTPVGALLSETHPQSLHGFALMMKQTQYLPFSELVHGIRTTEPGADRYYGRPLFDWMAEDPGREAVFSRGMAAVIGGLRVGMFDDYRLPPGRVVADVGGADGSVLVELLSRDDDPDRRGIVFERPTTLDHAIPTLAAAGLSGRVDLVGGDFFVSAPEADIYVLSHILHDWDDAASLRILARIAEAATPGARLLVLEGVVPDGDGPHLSKALDLNMLGVVTGKERSEQEYRELLDAAGFTLDRVVTTAAPEAIIEATLR